MRYPHCRLCGTSSAHSPSVRGGGGTGGGAGLLQTIHNVFSKVLGGANTQEMRKQCMNLHI